MAANNNEDAEDERPEEKCACTGSLANGGAQENNNSSKTEAQQEYERTQVGCGQQAHVLLPVLSSCNNQANVLCYNQQQGSVGERQTIFEQQQQQQNKTKQDEKRTRTSTRPLILITSPFGEHEQHQVDVVCAPSASKSATQQAVSGRFGVEMATNNDDDEQDNKRKSEFVVEKEEDKFEVIDGISYRIVAAVTKRPQQVASHNTSDKSKKSESGGGASKLSAIRRKSSAFVANLLHHSTSTSAHANRSILPSRSSHELVASEQQPAPPRRMSIYELTKSPPPETSIEMYLNERRRSSTVSAKFVQQQLEQQSTFETNYQARQQYFKDMNAKLVNQDEKLLNVVANRGRIHRHSVDIAQLPLHLAQAKGAAAAAAATAGSSSLRRHQQNRTSAEQQASGEKCFEEEQEEEEEEEEANHQVPSDFCAAKQQTTNKQQQQQLPAISEDKTLALTLAGKSQFANASDQFYSGGVDLESQQQQQPFNKLSLQERRSSLKRTTSLARRQVLVRRFEKFDAQSLSSAPAPDVKIGQRVAYKEYYGSEFGTIRWIGRVPQICADWTVGVEFDNAIGEGDGSLNGRRYFIAKDCFAKFLPLSSVALVEQHVGRPEPGTMISVMSAAVRPGQMISIQRVSTVHVQHCFLNAPHRMPGAEFLAINTRLHCQCPSCGPCAHVVKPPRTQRLRAPKNATHMCQFSTYTCCGMQSQEDALCTYTGNRVSQSPAPTGGLGDLTDHFNNNLPPIGNSWIEGSGYLSQLQAAQSSKLLPVEYRTGGSGAKQQEVSMLNMEQPSSMMMMSAQSNHHRRHRHHRHHRHKEYGRKRATSCDTHHHQAPVYENCLLNTVVKPSEPSEDNQQQHQQRIAPTTRRDSIENRYLFPSEDEDERDQDHQDQDVIDSTLEADLENLSQARYGPARRSPPTEGSSFNARQRRRRRHRHRHQNRRTHWHAEDVDCCRSSYASTNGRPPHRPHHLFRSLRNLVSCINNPSSSSSPSMLSLYDDDEQQIHNFATNPSTLAVQVYDSKNKAPCASELQCCTTTSCSSRAHSTIGSDAAAAAATTTTLLRTIETVETTKIAESAPNEHTSVRRQVSSSTVTSDCGFSSANSQNSINNLAAPPTSPPSADIETQRLNELYERLVTRLVHGSGGAAVTSDELMRLREALFAETTQNSRATSRCTPPPKQPQQQQKKVTSDAVQTGGGAADTSALPKAFELKLTLSIQNQSSQLASEQAAASRSSSLAC